MPRRHTARWQHTWKRMLFLSPVFHSLLNRLMKGLFCLRKRRCSRRSDASVPCLDQAGLHRAVVNFRPRVRRNAMLRAPKKMFWEVANLCRPLETELPWWQALSVQRWLHGFPWAVKTRKKQEKNKKLSGNKKKSISSYPAFFFSHNLRCTHLTKLLNGLLIMSLLRLLSGLVTCTVSD